MAIQRYNPSHIQSTTFALVGLNVAIAIADISTGGLLERYGWARGIDVQYGEYWRIFTSGWVHASIMHIAFNAYGIYVLGTITERLYGVKPLLVIYMAALLGGSGLSMVFYDPNIPTLGASGAAYGLFGAVLGFFYVRTGSIKGIMQVPMGRQLLLWLGIGVFISLQPGISFLGHLGGFVPGVFLGVFFEKLYMRHVDVWYWVGLGLVAAMIAGACVYGSFPYNRASWHAVQALRAYEQGDLARGDEYLANARRRSMRNDGTQKLMTHLNAWRAGHAEAPERFNLSVLRLPLTHPRGVTFKGEHMPDLPFTFLKGPGSAEPLESSGDAP
ncbi:MAG: rhomboid family intramembrane serine protease [Planctomycetes bacterium]|nr:rhomboid family intramembrane serine protease [Planctomycetota bacterium]MCW8137133.1 rhomboid family intramembrane serine protease [Planctomycetota bacterium]